MTDAWRGDLHPEPWPEELAGVEYAMYASVPAEREI